MYIVSLAAQEVQENSEALDEIVLGWSNQMLIKSEKKDNSKREPTANFQLRLNHLYPTMNDLLNSVLIMEQNYLQEILCIESQMSHRFQSAFEASSRH